MKPTNPGEVTVVVRNGSHFTGKLLRESDKKIAIGLPYGEIEWDKTNVKEIIRFGATDRVAKTGKPASASSESKEPTKASKGWAVWIAEKLTEKLSEE